MRFRAWQTGLLAPGVVACRAPLMPITFKRPTNLYNTYTYTPTLSIFFTISFNGCCHGLAALVRGICFVYMIYIQMLQAHTLTCSAEIVFAQRNQLI